MLRLPAEPRRSHWLLLAAGIWWVALAVQVWFSWDLNEVYAQQTLLLRIGPETPFLILGGLVGLIGVVTSIRRRAWLRGVAHATTLIAVFWVTWITPIPWLGAQLYLERHKGVFLEVIDEARAAHAAGSELPSHPSADPIFVEGDPPRFALARRWIGMFHWTAFVYDPDQTLEAQGRDLHRVFDYSLLGYQEMGEGWYLLWAIK